MLSNLQVILIERLFLSLSPRRVDKVLSGHKLFFITGMGRSGTAFLTDLLKQAPGVSVYHETKSDFNALVEAYWDPAQAEKYLQGTRKQLMAARIMHSRCLIYGEVNSLLRFHVDVLQHLSSPTILHLVRDGRDVVRSGMNRKAFTPVDAVITGRLRPHVGDSFSERWHSMDRFERICWYWASTMDYLLQRQIPVVRFEDILVFYESFKCQILKPLGVEISYERWEAEIKKPKNVTEHKTFPAWQDWTVEQKHQFRDICGKTMLDLGYEI